MRLSLFIALRYLFSPKSHSVINVISIISMIAVAVGALALIVVMSAFNGLEDLVGSLYSTFDPDITITANEGKTFKHSEFPEQEVRDMEDVAYYTRVVQETALLEYRGSQSIAVVKGVENEFLAMKDLDPMIRHGSSELKNDSLNFAVLGYGVAYQLSLYVENAVRPITMHAANRTAKYNPTNPASAFVDKKISAGGVFDINPDFNNTYVLVPFEFARDLFQYTDEVSAVELGLAPGADAEAIQKKLTKMLGPGFSVKTRYQLNEIIYKTSQTEKWIAFLIVSFILVIATFNIIGSLVMLIIEKKKDIFTLKSMGASVRTVKNVFLLEGVLISGLGGSLGLLLGIALVFLQQTVGIVRLQNVIVEYYPVQLSMVDVGAIFATVIAIGFVSSWFPVQLVVKRAFSRDYSRQ